MGYAVPEHLEALSRLGPTVHHRRSFSPVAVSHLKIAEMMEFSDEAV